MSSDDKQKPVKFQKHLLKTVGGVVLTRYLLLYALL